MKIIEEAKKIEEEIIRWRRDLHKFPELGLDLPKTAHYVMEALNEMNIPYNNGIAQSGIVALIEGKKNEKGKKKTLGIRADMDGLPIKEKTGLSFSSDNNNMHACGHDGHTAILLGAAKLLKKHEKEFYGNVKLIFQPGEEGPGGAKPMIEEQALENPRVDRMLGLHINTVIDEIPNGGIGIAKGPMMASADWFTLRIQGKGSHGAAPHAGVDPVTITAQVISALQTIVSRETKPMNANVITIGKINGGEAFNAIPDEIVMEGTVRTIEKKDQKFIRTRMEEMIHGICKGMRGDFHLEYTDGYPALVNDYDFTELIHRSAAKIIGDDKIHEIKKPVTMGGEDMAFFLEEVPGTYFFLGARDEGLEEQYPHHNARYIFDEGVLWKGSAIFVQSTLDYLNNPKGC